MAVPFIGLPQLRAAPGQGNALARLGETVGQGLDTVRQRNALRDFAMSGDPNTLIASGDPTLASAGLAEQNRLRTLQTRAQERAEDVAFRQEQLGLQRERLERTPAPLTVEDRIRIAQESRAPRARKTAKDVEGRQRFTDTGELVFPDVADTKAEKRQTRQQQMANLVSQDIDRAIDLVKGQTVTSPVTGAAGQFLSTVPIVGAGSRRADFDALIETIEGNIGFERLNQMRQESPTGGALGQVSNLELRQLNAALGALKGSQSEGQLVDNLNRVYNLFQDTIHGQGKGPQRRRLSFEQSQQMQQAQQAVNPPMSRADALASDVQGVPQTATNPQTGERIQWNPQTQAWEPM